MTGVSSNARVGKIAILIPVFNAGPLLRETMLSASKANLPGESYEIVISDNASSDGSTSGIPNADPQGAPITVHRNSANLGRVENWNCALEYAEQMGFSYAMVLMAGDVLTDTTVIALRDRMAELGAVLGMASYQVVDETLRPLRIARRIRCRNGLDFTVAPARFLAQFLATGAMLYGPLGANLYRIDGSARLRFNPADPTHTDQLATALFAQAANRPIVYLDRPISCWRERPQRFHSTMTSSQRLNDDFRVIEHACSAAGVRPDYGRIRATLLLRTLVGSRGNLHRALHQVREATGGRLLSLSWLTRLALRQFQHHTPWLAET
ncbi:MAG: glycosyltransferase [Alphaproteobacteria bacterium]|nr:glycosyltransferase [Alphaproteobacteria bacterium]